MSKTTPFEKNKSEIKYNLINCALAGGLVLVGAFAAGGITWDGVLAATAAALLTAMVKFKDYWDGEKGEYSCKLLNFI